MINRLGLAATIREICLTLGEKMLLFPQVLSDDDLRKWYAGLITHGIMSNGVMGSDDNSIRWTVDYADKLIERLKETEKPADASNS